MSLRRVLRRAANQLGNLFDHPRLILTWHRIGADGDADPAMLAVAPARFAEQLRVLTDSVQVVTLADLQKSTGRGVALTFDDGYADNLEHAAPALLSAGLPGTVFVTSGFLDRRDEVWWDQVAQVLCGDHLLPPLLPVGFDALPLTTSAQRLAAYQAVCASLLPLSTAGVTARIGQLTDWSGHRPILRPSRRFLATDELLRLAAVPGITIGAHTINHPSLAQVPAAERRTELEDSRRTLEGLIGRAVDQVAYPYGTTRDVDAATVAAARSAGYRVAVTTAPGQVHRWSDPLRLPRFTIRNWDAAEFTRRLQWFWRSSDHGGQP